MRDNYIFDWISVYSGNATCNLPSIKPSHPQVQSQPVLVVPASIASELQEDQLSVTSEVTGTVRLYHRTELTMTVQLTATSPFGEITEMQVWTDANPNPVWQPFSEYGWLEWFPEHDVIYARFRDELGNESSLANDTTHPVYSPPPEPPFQQLWLPILLKPQ